MNFIEYLKSLRPKDWNTKVTDKWTVKDVVAHMVGWEKRDAEVIPIFWETKKKAPWMSTREEWDKFNDIWVEYYRDYTPEELMAEWEVWQKKITEEIDKIGHNLKARPDLFDWLLDGGEGSSNVFTMNADGSHYQHHLKQIRQALVAEQKISVL